LCAEERREAIIKAVRRVFAEKGFHGTTTRELAEAAGVSEALLFKHFPTKEALYSAMHLPCKDEQVSAEIKRLMGLEPSTSTLVLLVHFLVTKLVLGRGHCGAGEDSVNCRLILRSLMEDGEFARVILEHRAACWVGKVVECVRAAAAAGDLSESPLLANLGAWFVHHLTVMLMLHLQPPTPAVDYGVPRDRLAEQAVWFALRGLGLHDEAIRRHYNPKAFALFTS
jgi:AcrR family transcriptional regulator